MSAISRAGSVSTMCFTERATPPPRAVLVALAPEEGGSYRGAREAAVLP